MFSSKSKASTPAPSASSSSHAPMPPNMASKRAGRSSAPSIISADLIVNGTLTSTGDIQIDGRVEGDVNSAGLVIGEKAFIHGEVLAEDVTVRGRVQGGIRARKVLLAATCHVEGNILHEAFAVETGAFFEGNCRHSDNPMAEESRRGAEYDRRPAAVQAQPRAVDSAPAAQPAPRAAAATFTPLKSGA